MPPVWFITVSKFWYICQKNASPSFPFPSHQVATESQGILSLRSFKLGNIYSLFLQSSCQWMLIRWSILLKSKHFHVIQLTLWDYIDLRYPGTLFTCGFFCELLRQCICVHQRQWTGGCLKLHLLYQIQAAKVYPGMKACSKAYLFQWVSL